MKRTRVAQIGLGAMGQMMVSCLVDRPDLELVAAFDTDPTKLGQDVGKLCSIGELGVLVRPPTEDELASCRADIALHATSSWLKEVQTQLRTAMKAGLRVISTCEELSYPFKRHPQIATQLDDLAKSRGVALLGSGVNPGYVMDLLPLLLTGVCRHVNRVHVLRVMDADTKRIGFQKKIGAGMSAAAFKQAAGSGKFGHIGLPESAWLIADALKWEPDEFKESLEPVIARTAFQGRQLELQTGDVAGLHQKITAMVKGRPVVELEFMAFLGAPDPRDETHIYGVPEVAMRIGGGVPGDIATAAVAINSIPFVLAASPGLLTVKDMASVRSRRL